MRRTLAALVTASLVLLTPAAAQAATSTTRKDAQGDVASNLDLKRVTLTKDGKKIVVTFRTWEAIADEDLTFPGGLGADFRISKKIIRGAAVRYRDGEVSADICSYRVTGSGEPRKCSTVPSKRTGDSSFRITIPLKRIDKGTRTLRWRASSFAMAGTAGCPDTCIDSAGKGGAKYYRWKL
ncbi:hypothetical protein [Nocardioides ferulae]|uniref:hypothetical protein n=1 Tax=Nocardioides ferulae TaxID=2340821 RepID=UPI000EAC879A|nr:hypothetical protein [Nocardioides ferulae]